jgi:hypothetical protein
MRRNLTLGLLAFFCLASCSKADLTLPETGYLSIINASPTLATYNVYLNAAQLNTAALPFGGTMPYSEQISGDYVLKFTSAGSTDSLRTKNITVSTNLAHSYFLFGQGENLEVLETTDNNGTPVTDKAAVRMVSLVSDAPLMDLTTNDNTVVIGKQGFKQVSNFVAIDPNTYKFDIRERSTGEVKITLSNVTLTAGKYYTILLKGKTDPAETEQPLAAQLIGY